LLERGSDDTACDDGNACTAGDHCAGGACVPSSTLACDPCEVCTPSGCAVPTSLGCQPRSRAASRPSCCETTHATPAGTSSRGGGRAAPRCRRRFRYADGDERLHALRDRPVRRRADAAHEPGRAGRRYVRRPSMLECAPDARRIQEQERRRRRHHGARPVRGRGRRRGKITAKGKGALLAVPSGTFAPPSRCVSSATTPRHAGRRPTRRRRRTTAARSGQSPIDRGSREDLGGCGETCRSCSSGVS
jgi:hypothetical protein